jgi:formylglycine-generating enzyme required for sulfatase activity
LEQLQRTDYQQHHHQFTDKGEPVFPVETVTASRRPDFYDRNKRRDAEGAEHRKGRFSVLLRVPLRSPRLRVDLIENDLVKQNKNSSSNKIMKNKNRRFPALSLAAMAMLATLNASAQLRLGITQVGNDSVLSWPTTVSNCVLQSTTNLTPETWLTVSNVVVLVNNSFTVTVTNTARARFFRLYNTNTPPVPADMVLIPAGSFTMGDTFSEGDSSELPLHTVYVSAFYMDRYDVTYSLWQSVYNWATNHGYNFDNAGAGKATNHPALLIDWYDCVKWCNARSEMEGRVPAYYTSAAQTTVYRTGEVDVDNSSVKWNAGYRLPTEAEWEKAARGGASGQRFPWGNTISWSQANYYAYPSGYAYDVNPTSGYAFNDGVWPYTSPVNYFAPNGYGLYDMEGNVFQWCWDWYGIYRSASQTDPRGPTTGSLRVTRGGSYSYFAFLCRTAYRDFSASTLSSYYMGFRSVLSPGQ